jgi:hypothetical protein
MATFKLPYLYCVVSNDVDVDGSGGGLFQGLKASRIAVVWSEILTRDLPLTK